MPAWLTRDAMADGGEREIDLWARCAAKAAMRRRRSGARRRVLVSVSGDARPPNKSTTAKVAANSGGTCERRDGGETQWRGMVAAWSTCPLETACSCCAVLCWLDEEGAAVMIQIELGSWLTCRIWDGMRLLGTVRKVGRSPANIRLNIRWNIR